MSALRQCDERTSEVRFWGARLRAEAAAHDITP